MTLPGPVILAQWSILCPYLMTLSPGEGTGFYDASITSQILNHSILVESPEAWEK